MKQRDRETAGHRRQGGTPVNNMKTGLHALAPALALAPELAPPRAQVVVAAAGASVQHQDPQDPAGASVKYQDSQEPPVLAPAAAVATAAGAGFSVKYQGRTMITCKSAHGRRERSPATSNRKTKDDPQRQKTADEHTHTHNTQPSQRAGHPESAEPTSGDFRHVR